MKEELRKKVNIPWSWCDIIRALNEVIFKLSAYGITLTYTGGKHGKRKIKESTFGLSGTDFRVCAVFNRGSRWRDCSGQIYAKPGEGGSGCSVRGGRQRRVALYLNYERQEESGVYVDGQTYLRLRG